MCDKRAARCRAGFQAGGRATKHLLFTILIAVPGLAGGQPLLDFRNDLAFDAVTVEVVAEQAYRKRLRALAADGRLDKNPELLARLQALVLKLQPAIRYERPDAAAIDWEIHICRRCGENAAAMAGGKLLVGEEFIAEMAFTDDELGYVLAHEVAHVLAEHTREFATAARFFVDRGRHRRYEDIQNELDESFVVNLRMAPVYALQEFDADYIGYILGARSGFEPEAMPRMMRKLHAGSPAGFSRHPDADERIRRVEAMLQAAHRIRAMHYPARGR